MAFYAALIVGLSLGLAGSLSAQAEPPAEYTLENGLRVRLVPQRGDKQTIVLLGVRAGILEEPDGVPHLAHVTEHLTVFDVALGNETLPPEWHRKNKSNGETLADWMYFDVHAAPEDVDEALRVQAARLGAIEFSRETLLREIPRTLGEIDFVESSEFPVAGKFALVPFVQAALHGRTDVAIRARTHEIAVDGVQRFHARTFRPDRAMVVVVGEFDIAAARRSIQQHFGGVAKPADPAARRAVPKPGDRVATWDVSTRHLMIAWPVPSAEDRDHPALTLVSLAVTERLAADAGLRALGDAMPHLNDTEGMFLINLQAKGGADLEALKTRVMDQVAGLAGSKGLNDGDLQRLRASFAQMMMIDVDLSRIPLPPGITKTTARANIELQRMARSLVWGDLNAYRKRLEEQTPGDVRRAVRKHLAPEAASIVRVEGPEQKS